MIVVDFSHVGRRSSGIERITEELFSPKALAPLPVKTVRCGASRTDVVYAQYITLPAEARKNPDSVFLFSGYPPSFNFPMYRTKTVLYVHDLFLLTRQADLNLAGKLYLAPHFRRALKSASALFCNSQRTFRDLLQHGIPRTNIRLFRPPIRDVFSVGDAARKDDTLNLSSPLKVVSLGTVEPRKNFLAAARICEALSSLLPCRVEYHIIGRRGWGEDWNALAAHPNTIRHGWLSEDAVRGLILAADVVLCTSKDEGLCLPLLELQYAGIPIVAPDEAVYHEVLGSSGIFTDPANIAGSAKAIADAIIKPGSLTRYRNLAAANITRWNALAVTDRTAAVDFLGSLIGVCAK